MTKANLSQLENVKKLQELQEYLNKYFSWMDNCYSVQVGQTTDKVILNLLENLLEGENETVNTYVVDMSNDMEQVIKGLISKVYEQDINWRNKIINSWKFFTKRKIGSMSKWMQKGNAERVTEINKELVQKYNEVEGLKYEVRDLKTLIAALYHAKEGLCEAA